MGATTLTATAAQGAQQAASLLRLLDPISGELSRVEDALHEQVRDFHAGVDGYVEYVLGASGKRLRPSLALLAGGATGRIDAGHITLGAIVELIHVATLVHDDILDEAELRHGVATSNSLWGNEIGVLLGDCLFAHALKLAASYPTTEVCRKVSDATNTVCSGEILQTQRRFDLSLTLEQYLEIIKMKTGALFAVSCELGAALNEAPPTVVKAMREFGANLGIAYQIFDDCVDIFGQERKAGKSLGTDVKKGKLTLPFLLLLRATDLGKRQEIGQAIFSGESAAHRQLLELASRNGVVTESFAAIRDFLNRAEANLSVLPAGLYTAALSGLAGYLGEQSASLLKETVAR
jgi:octaprenyl-diphosphate synthase